MWSMLVCGSDRNLLPTAKVPPSGVVPMATKHTSKLAGLGQGRIHMNPPGIAGGEAYTTTGGHSNMRGGGVGWLAVHAFVLW